MHLPAVCVEGEHAHTSAEEGCTFTYYLAKVNMHIDVGHSLEELSHLNVDEAKAQTEISNDSKEMNIPLAPELNDAGQQCLFSFVFHVSLDRLEEPASVVHGEGGLHSFPKFESKLIKRIRTTRPLLETLAIRQIIRDNNLSAGEINSILSECISLKLWASKHELPDVAMTDLIPIISRNPHSQLHKIGARSWYLLEKTIFVDDDTVESCLEHRIICKKCLYTYKPEDVYTQITVHNESAYEIKLQRCTQAGCDEPLVDLKALKSGNIRERRLRRVKPIHNGAFISVKERIANFCFFPGGVNYSTYHQRRVRPGDGILADVYDGSVWRTDLKEFFESTDFVGIGLMFTADWVEISQFSTSKALCIILEHHESAVKIRLFTQLQIRKLKIVYASATKIAHSYRRFASVSSCNRCRGGHCRAEVWEHNVPER